MPTLHSLNLSSGGMPKLPVPSARLTLAGLEGDWQTDRIHHGGPNRAICLFSLELYQRLAGLGISLSPGQVGENLTTSGLDLDSLKIGDQLQIGVCTIEITKVRKPCHKLDRWHPDLLKLIEGHSGWLARVVTEGTLHPGDAVIAKYK